MVDSASYTVTCVPLQDQRALERDWRELETRSHRSFFLSWTWIGTWLHTFKPECHVLRVELGGVLIALGLIVRSEFHQRFRFASSRIHLHQKGNAICDQIWTEYNGLLCQREFQESAIASAMHYLIKELPGWDELVLGAVTRQTAEQLERASGLARLDLWHTRTYGVDLKSIAEQKADYIDTLSKNTRYQIRRSLRLYEETSGAVTLQFAHSLEDALQFFNDAAPLHLERWGAGLKQSGFANEKFVAFHRELIRRGWAEGQIDLIRVQSGTRVLGYFYNFCFQGIVYFYLSGLIGEVDGKFKPGLCGHALSINHYVRKGMVYYDFMGGEERYKSSLGQCKDELFQLSLQKDRAHFRVENFLRSVKHRLGY